MNPGAKRGESSPAPVIDAGARKRLESRIQRAARRGAGELVSATWQVPAGPASLADLLRGAGPPDRWTLIEQPERGGRGLLALGSALTLEVGTQRRTRFAELSARWQAISAQAQTDPPGGIAGAGLVLVGGAAFAPGGGQAPQWSGFGAGEFVVPELTIARAEGRVAVTVTRFVRPGDDAARHLEVAERTLALLLPAHADPEREAVAAAEVSSVLPEEHFTAAVDRAIGHVQAGTVEKVVVAREVDVTASAPWDPVGVIERLGTRFPGCFVFGIGKGDAVMAGASPELLLRRDGQRAETVALAGSSRRSDDPHADAELAAGLLASAKDRHEHQLVVQRIVHALEPSALWVTSQPEPQVVTVANVHHLATPIRAQLDASTGVIELIGALHPTPAVGGEPGDAAAKLIPQLDGFDRGWYAAPIGWVDQAGDGEFFVGLRSGLLRGARARLFAGVGVVAESDPADELAETNVKLGAVLGALCLDG